MRTILHVLAAIVMLCFFMTAFVGPDTLKDTVEEYRVFINNKGGIVHSASCPSEAHRGAQ